MLTKIEEFQRKDQEKNMFNPISKAFKKAEQENRPALLTYTVAGDSTKVQSLKILKSISKNFV